MLVRTLIRIRSSALGKRHAPLESTWRIIGWWEARRIPFNLIVGATGVVTSVAILLIAAVMELFFGLPVEWPDPPIIMFFGVVFFAVAANACYTMGWILELLVKRVWPEESDRFGTLTLTLGLLFSVIVTLTPAVAMAGLAALVLLARWLERQWM